MGTTTVPPLTAHLMTEPQTGPHTGPHPGPHAYPTPHVNHEQIHLSREKVPWHAGVWEAIDRVVADEVHRTSVVTKFMPHLKVGHQMTNIEQDIVLSSLPPSGTPFVPPTQLSGQTAPIILAVDETAQIFLVELSLNFGLSQAQVTKENERHSKQPEHHEMHGAPAAHHEQPGHHEHSMHHDHYHSSTAMMLVRRAASTLALARDALIFLAQAAFPTPGSGGSGIPLFSTKTVLFNAVPVVGGLTCIGGSPTPLESIPVAPVNTPQGSSSVPAEYSTNTVAAISKAVTDLAANGYGGPFVAVLPQYFFADSLIPLAAGPVTALIRPADIIVPQLNGGYFPSVVLPALSPPLAPNLNLGGNPLGFSGLPLGAQGVGFVLSTGGDTVQLVNGLDPVAAHSQIDTNGNFIFQLKTRAIGKISDAKAIVQIVFM